MNFYLKSAKMLKEHGEKISKESLLFAEKKTKEMISELERKKKEEVEDREKEIRSKIKTEHDQVASRLVRSHQEEIATVEQGWREALDAAVARTTEKIKKETRDETRAQHVREEIVRRKKLMKEHAIITSYNSYQEKEITLCII